MSPFLEISLLVHAPKAGGQQPDSRVMASKEGAKGLSWSSSPTNVLLEFILQSEKENQ